MNDKVLLSGLAVVILYTLLPVLLPLISPVLGELDYSWLADAEITLGEIVGFIGALLVAISNRVKQAARATFFAAKK